MDEDPRILDSHSHYTVGWLAPLPIERAAAEALLDEQHEEPRDFQQPTSDPLSYSFGRIGKHNIVIASLESGFYGIVSAATTATSMLSTFPEIRFGLLVGIGGGIPRPDSYDVRLGDVVVGHPSGSSGGVVQYDLLKAKAGGEKERKGILNPPPAVLLHALAKLQSHHERKGSSIPKILQEMKERNPLMFKKRPNNPGYGYQDDKNDRLFKSSYEHVQGKDCQGCSREEEVEREPRENGNDPEIHYGVIASGNTLVKDSVAREDLLKHIPDDCICYEMEAAGLMNNFPCLVIRGICDYSDSHKNDRWQRYAAATAASFAKELLSFVRPEMVHGTQKASQVINSISNDLKETREISRDNKVMISEQKIMNWLDPPDPSRNYQNAKSQRQKDTCHWFLDSNEFRSWKDRPKSFLWVHGIAGCGKTVLSSAIIQTIRGTCSEQTHALLYFYFDFNDQGKQTCDHMVRAFLAQMYHSSEEARNRLSSLHESIKGEQPSTADLFDWFTSLTNCFKDIQVVLDALDEVKETRNRRELLSMLTELVRVEGGRVSCIAMSRNELDISTALSNIGSTIEINSKSVSRDIRQYVQTMISGEGFKKWHQNHKVLEEVESYLTSKSNGMFRWVACQMEVLEECLDEASLRRALTELPATLEDTYNRALRRIPKSQQCSALRLLQFLAFSERSISVGEARDIVAVDLSRQPEFCPSYWMPVPEDILRFCPTMLTIDRKRPKDKQKLRISDRLRLAHLTVKEYLLKPMKMDEEFREVFREPLARAAIFEISLGYIVSIASLYHEASNLPFTDMAVLDLMIHARKSDGEQTVAEKVLNFLQPQKSFSFWLHRYCKKSLLGFVATDGSDDIESLPSPLFIAAYFGLENLIRQLKHEESRTPIQVASGKDVPFWLYRRHDVEICRSTSLYAAAMGGQNTVFKMLLKDFTCLNDICGPLGTVLDVACLQGRTKIVSLILQEATKNHYELNFGKAFATASLVGHFDIMQLLLDYGVPTRPIEPPCSWQSTLDTSDRNKLVLDVLFAYLGEYTNQSQPAPYGLSHTWPDRMYLPLRAIFRRGNSEKMVSHLTPLKVDKQILKILVPFVLPTALLEMRDEFGWPVLHLAITKALEGDGREVVSFLLEVAQSLGCLEHLLQIQSDNGQTALHVAVRRDKISFAMGLVRAANSSTAEVYEKTDPLRHTAQMGQTSLLQAFLQEGDTLLIEKGKEEFLQDLLQVVDDMGLWPLRLNLEQFDKTSTEDGANLPFVVHNWGFMDPKRTGLSSFRASSHSLTLMKLLIDKGADTNAKDHEGMTPLHYAAKEDNFPAILILVQGGANPRAMDNKGHTPLNHVKFRWPLGIRFTGIDQRSVANPELPHLSAFWLHHAAVHGDHRRARQIIESEEMWFSIVNSRDIKYDRTPLHRAAARGWRKVVNLLIDFGAELDPRDKCGKAPFDYAAGHPEIKNILDGTPKIYVSDRMTFKEGRDVLDCRLRTLGFDFESFWENN